MGLPKKKSSKRSKKARASHFALASIKTAECSKCKKPVLAHRVCTFCGTYKGREVIEIESKLDKKKKKEKGKKSAKPEKKEENK